MTDQTADGSVVPARASSRAEPSGAVVGGAIFAAVMMMVIGVFQVFAGLAALINNSFYVVTRNYAFHWNVTAWGWVHLLLGIVVAVAGYAVFSGRLWARIVGITVAMLSMIANFLFIPYYPFWALTVIALDAWVIWSLAKYSREAADMG